ncbi:MAG TPA: hypothetical protein VK465_02585, partial [Fibrobacteria bacterium]|nr:hypothetical protein [Fibrobacteria bacterium]
MGAKHRWTFFRAGGFDQVKLATGADLMNLDSLDQTLWVALACPVNGLEIDTRTLSLIDTDRNGRVRVGELIAAVKFAGAALKNPDDLLKGSPSLPLSAINDATPEGRALLATARQVLANAGRSGADAVTVDDVSDRVRLFAGTAFNGDGVVTRLSTTDAGLQKVIQEIRDTVGGLPDLSGETGVGPEQVAAFFEEVRARAAWEARGAAEAGQIFPLGRGKTEAAA